MKSKFQKRLFFSVAGLITLLVVLALLLLPRYIQRNLREEAISKLELRATSTANQIDDILSDMNRLSLYISTNPEIVDSFQKAKIQEHPNHKLTAEVIEVLTTVTIPKSVSSYRISLFNQKGNFVSTGLSYQQDYIKEFIGSPAYQQWFETLPLHQQPYGTAVFSKDTWSDNGIEYLSFYREIFSKQGVGVLTGVVEIQYPADNIKTLLATTEDKAGAYLFDVRTGQIVSSSERLTQESLEFVKTFSLLKETTGYHEGDYFYAAAPITEDFLIAYVQPSSIIAEALRPAIFLMLTIGSAVLLSWLVVLFFITRYISRPLQQLSDSVKQVDLDNLSVSVDTNTTDEIVQLQNTFQSVLLRLDESIENNLKLKTYEMQANMIALQAQMDPHFLYNFLAVMQAMAKEGSTDDIVLACNYLSQMLRYISSYDKKTVPLSQDILQGERYLNIMKLRFEEQLSYSIIIDETLDTESIEIPHLSLQPLLENAFQHGFKAVAPPWSITVRGEKHGNCWRLSVANSGATIQADEIAKTTRLVKEFLQNPSDSLATLKIGGMGLVNTLARFELRYGKNAYWSLEPLEKGGTIITLGGSIDSEDIYR